MVFEDVSDLLGTKNEAQTALVPDILRLSSTSTSVAEARQQAVPAGEDDRELAPEQDSSGSGVDGELRGVHEDKMQTADLDLDPQTPIGEG
ncbi:hypothetical protein LTR49_024910 [Elasticomyces elasticus]|nr:hypothetical protein LTR49_024910 [Elasticomyces elasticus]